MHASGDLCRCGDPSVVMVPTRFALNRTGRRKGFSLIELLVVVAILAVLIGLLLAAVQRVRLAAAQSRSTNNLRQIVLAAHGHDAAHGTLPDFVTSIDNDPTMLGVSSVFTKILPHIEQEALYRQAQLGPGALSVTVPSYIGPSDPTATDPNGFTSYVANYAVFKTAGLSLSRSFPDGVSHTLLFTERYLACGTPKIWNAWPTTAPGSIVHGRSNTAPAWLGMDSPQFAPATGAGSNACNPDRASSATSSGILAAMGDGTVRFVSSAATTSIASNGFTNWQAALTPGGGETLGSSW